MNTMKMLSESIIDKEMMLRYCPTVMEEHEDDVLECHDFIQDVRDTEDSLRQDGEAHDICNIAHHMRSPHDKKHIRMIIMVGEAFAYLHFAE